MGAGKSSVARKIARWQHLSSIDIDVYLERQEGLSVTQIFSERGEEAFRDLETAFLETMPSRERTVLSCGGGIVIRQRNRELLKALGTVVYLRVSPENVLRRVGGSSNRPLLNGAIAPDELLRQRQQLYEEVANLTVPTDECGINQVAREVIRKLKARGEL
jgi:shikimate kinase